MRLTVTNLIKLLSSTEVPCLCLTSRLRVSAHSYCCGELEEGKLYMAWAEHCFNCYTLM